MAAARETLSMVDAAQARALLIQANTQLTAAQNQLAATRKDAQALEAAHHRIQTQEHQVHESEENLERARDKASSAREELVVAQAAADQLAKSLKFGSRDEAQQALAQLDERIAQLDQTRTQAQDKVRQTQEARDRCAAKLETLTQRIHDFVAQKTVRVDETADELARAQALHEELSTQVQQVSSKIQQN